MRMADFSKLSRAKHIMPAFVKEALNQHNLVAAYKERPAYQQNDYLGWISRAKRPETQKKRTKIVRQN